MAEDGDVTPGNVEGQRRSNRKTTPPKFKESMPYRTWKNKLKMWQIVTSVPKTEQALVVLLEGLDEHAKAERAVGEFSAEELNIDGGMTLLIEKLDSVFEREQIDEAYSVYSKFINMSRNESSDMSEYIVEFDHLYKRMTEFDMKVPDAILAFRLLDGANINGDDRKLALALCKNEYVNNY